jgi:chromosomal replication initiation ATPase DnaA
MRKDIRIRLIFKAVETVTGINRQTVTSGSRIREIVFARIIATHHLKKCGLTTSNICSLVGAAHATTIMYQLKLYLRERSPYFVSCAAKVEHILSQHKS